jgi:hypothetical protein
MPLPGSREQVSETDKVKLIAKIRFLMNQPSNVIDSIYGYVIARITTEKAPHVAGAQAATSRQKYRVCARIKT